MCFCPTGASQRPKCVSLNAVSMYMDSPICQEVVTVREEVLEQFTLVKAAGKNLEVQRSKARAPHDRCRV